MRETQNQDSIPMTTHSPTPSTPSSETKKTHRVKLTRPDPERSPRQANEFIKNSKDHHLSSKGNEGEGVESGGAMATIAPPPASCVVQEEISGRERLKRHRVEMAGRVWIPDVWGQEDYLKDWIDCTVFDSTLGNNTIMSARAALVDEGRTSNSGILRIENRC